MYSTATDLAKFITFQFENSKENESVLSANNKAMMQAFNIGWRPSYPFITHDGAMLGYRCEIAFNPLNKLGWVVLTNATNFDFSRLNDYFSRLLMHIYKEKPVTDINKFAGIYKLSNSQDSLKIFVKDERLYSTYLNDIFPHRSLKASGDNSFIQEGNPNYKMGYNFILDEDSNIKSLNLEQLQWIKQ